LIGVVTRFNSPPDPLWAHSPNPCAEYRRNPLKEA
jgi:hypothetical protein